MKRKSQNWNNRDKNLLSEKKPHKWLTAVKKITVLGVGAGVPQAAMAVVSFVINNQIMKYSGASALAVYGFLGTVSALFLSIFSGIGQSAQPIVSENFGARQQMRYIEVGKTGMITAVIFGIVSLLHLISETVRSRMVSFFTSIVFAYKAMI